MIASLLMFLFVIHFCAHVHVLPNGRIIVHSHAIPQSGKTSKSHSHNYLSLIYFNQVAHAHALAGLALFFVLLLLIFSQLFPFVAPRVSRHSFSLFQRRGPPVAFA